MQPMDGSKLGNASCHPELAKDLTPACEARMMMAGASSYLLTASVSEPDPSSRSQITGLAEPRRPSLASATSIVESDSESAPGHLGGRTGRRAHPEPLQPGQNLPGEVRQLPQVIDEVEPEPVEPHSVQPR
jgi:hypothetical protein